MTFRPTQGSIIAPPAPVVPEVGAFWVSGIFEGTADFDPDGPAPVSRTANVDNDHFLAQFLPDGMGGYELGRVHRVSHAAVNSPRLIGGTNFDGIDLTQPMAVDLNGNAYFVFIVSGGDAEFLDDADASFGAPGPVLVPRQLNQSQQIGFVSVDATGALRWFKTFPFTGVMPLDGGDMSRYGTCAVSADGTRCVLAFTVQYGQAGTVNDPGGGAVPNDFVANDPVCGVVLVLDASDGSVLRQEYTREAGQTDDRGTRNWSISDMSQSDDFLVGWETSGDATDAVEWDSGGPSPAAQATFVNNGQRIMSFSRHSLTAFQHTLFTQRSGSSGSAYWIGGQTAIDSSGNAYFAVMTPFSGATTESMERTPTTLSSSTSVSAGSILLACHDANGDEVWVQEWTRTVRIATIYGMALSLDGSRLYIALNNTSFSAITDTVTVDGNPIAMPGRSTAIICVSTVDGSLVWVKQPTGDAIQARQISVQRDSGTILIACAARNGADLDFGEVVIPASTWSAGSEQTPFAWVLTEDGVSATTTHIVRVLEAATGSANHAIGIGGY